MMWSPTNPYSPVNPLNGLKNTNLFLLDKEKNSFKLNEQNPFSMAFNLFQNNKILGSPSPAFNPQVMDGGFNMYKPDVIQMNKEGEPSFSAP